MIHENHPEYLKLYSGINEILRESEINIHPDIYHSEYESDHIVWNTISNGSYEYPDDIKVYLRKIENPQKSEEYKRVLKLLPHTVSNSYERGPIYFSVLDKLYNTAENRGLISCDRKW